jgi:hypothetical protein
MLSTLPLLTRVAMPLAVCRKVGQTFVPPGGQLRRSKIASSSAGFLEQTRLVDTRLNLPFQSLLASGTLVLPTVWLEVLGNLVGNQKLFILRPTIELSWSA